MAPVRRGAGNLPAELTSFVGRRGELAEVRRLLAGSRLVTLTGIGGVGKTRLALRAAAGLRRAFPGGVWLVQLDQLRDDALVAEAVAGALGLQDRAGYSPAASLAEYLAGRQLLLVLDNCEHLVDAAAKLTDLLLRAAAGLRVLATSREALNTTGETVLPVPPLAAPEAGHPLTAAELALFPAAGLFAERPRRWCRGSPSPRRTWRRWPGSAVGWRGCRWPSSWPRRGCRCCPRSRSMPGWATGWACSPGAAAASRPGSRRCGPRSTGAMSCAARPNGCCGLGCRCSPAGLSWTRRRASAPITGWPPNRCWSCWPRWPASRS